MILVRKQVLLGAGAAVALAAVVGLGVVLAGLAPVAATTPHSRPVAWLLRQAMERGVRAGARAVALPPGIDLHDATLAESAFGHYSVACTPCHGAPGVAAAPWMVTNPPSPPLVANAGRWSDAELYWIIKHGLKMTGMPALGPTHKDEQLWAIAAFVRQLPTMTPAAYQAMAERHHAARASAPGHHGM